MEKNSSPAETSGKQKVRSAEVGTDILKALAELSPATSLSRLAEHVGMPASKVHRYLQALIASGFAVQDASTNHYSLGREALRVGLAALDSMDVLKSAAAPLAELRDELNETCFLAVWGNRGATVVQVEQAVRAVTVVTQVGSVLPLLGSSTGLVFAAFLPEREVAELREEELAGRADHPLADPAAYAVLLEGIRARGLHAIHGLLMPGVEALSAPVFDAAGGWRRCSRWSARRASSRPRSRGRRRNGCLRRLGLSVGGWGMTAPRVDDAVSEPEGDVR